MLKSLYSGVSGLQAHQVAMDVESNNIANVNTVGFKYSRANFSDLLAQTNQIATAPQGGLGGKNAMQIGLGTSASSMTRIFSQGSIQNSDKNTDVAIQGDGFFIVSPDGGKTYNYTRAGDFKFDANGNFVDNNGFIVQGWLRDEDTGKVDATAPIQDIVIPPGLTTPAKPTSEIRLKANLNSGDQVESFSAVRALDAFEKAADLNRDGILDKEDRLNPKLNNGNNNYDNVLDPNNTDIYNEGDGDANTNLDQIHENTPKRFFTDPESGKRIEVGEDLGVTVNEKGEGFLLQKDQGVKISFINDSNGDPQYKNYRYTTDSNQVGWSDTDNDGNVDTYYFKTTEDLRQGMQTQLRELDQNLGHIDQDSNNTVHVYVDDNGKFTVSNPNENEKSLNIQVEALTDSTTTENVKFTQAMQSLSGALPAGSTAIRQSQGFNVPTHSSSIDIYDSLGTKHTVKIDFRKESYDKTTGSTWKVFISVPEPGVINTGGDPDQAGLPSNVIYNGQVKFNADGSLASFNPSSISFTANNGSASNQNINLLVGTANAFDGLTSFDSKSTTSGISQDGYTGGDLVGIRIDQSGTLVGSFSNGRSFGLAQIAMAKFANNEGLAVEGGNLYSQSANSGDPIIGTAATGGRGFIQSSALESSNVDLSRALTQLIIIQRGYQANGKTITTSDQLLQTLIGLKQ